MKDIKSVFEKMGLVEKVGTHIAQESQLSSAEIDELQKGGTGIKENVNVRENIERASVSSGEIENRKLLKAGEIYDSSNIKSQGTNSLFIIESYLKALPDYLPNDVKRDSVLNIVTSSGMNITNLLSDGKEKLKCLKSFSQSFSQEVKDAIATYEGEIKKLSGVIDSYNKIIDDIKNLEEEQEAVVDYEIEKINNIIQFVALEN